jgi:sugar lactone lactonase YvrE
MIGLLACTPPSRSRWSGSWVSKKLAGNSKPRIERVLPSAAIPGGEVVIHGSGFETGNSSRPRALFGDAEGAVLIAASSQLVASVPQGASGGTVRVSTPRGESNRVPVQVGVQVADNLHPVGNPSVDSEGNIYVTFSGQRGQKVAVSLYKITSNYQVKPFVTELMNPTGLALDRAGTLYVSCRNDGTVHKVTPDGRSQQWIEGMGIATGLAFDKDHNLFVGDRSGTIFKISPDRHVFVFATLEPSIAAYHLAFSPQGELYVTGPTTSSFDPVYRINNQGQVSVFYRGLGRPQGLAFDRQGNLYIAASHLGRRGIVRITPSGQPELALSGSGIVGLALLPTRRAVLTTTDSLFTLDWDVEGLPLFD